MTPPPRRPQPPTSPLREVNRPTDPLREARVDLSAISSNVEALRRAVGTDHVMAVVKARGYGHGAVRVAGAALMGGADWLGVAEIAEAIELRRAGITAPVLTWLHGSDAPFAEAISLGIDIGVSSPSELERAAAASAPGRTAEIQVKVDTGLSRNGVPEPQVAAVFTRAAELERLGRLHVRGVFSHLANAGETDDAAQLDAFENSLAIAESLGLAPELRHLASTAAALRVPRSRFDLVRLGIGIYGLSPFDDAGSADLGLIPAMELSARVVSTRRVEAGSGISYGYSYRTPTTSTLALIPLGYADGIPRQASNRGPVVINGHRYRVAGRIAMDQFVVDVGDDEVGQGDRAVLFGDPLLGVPSADEWAVSADTINYDIVTRIGGRVELTYPDTRARDSDPAATNPTATDPSFADPFSIDGVGGR